MRILALIALLCLTGCGVDMDHFRSQAERHCDNQWADSGFEYRLVDQSPDKQSPVFACQVKVGDGWIDSDNVKVDLR